MSVGHSHLFYVGGHLFPAFKIENNYFRNHNYSP